MYQLPYWKYFLCHAEVIDLRKVADVNVLLILFGSLKKLQAVPWSDAGSRPAGLDPRGTISCLALGWLVMGTWGCWQCDWGSSWSCFWVLFMDWAESLRAWSVPCGTVVWMALGRAVAPQGSRRFWIGSFGVFTCHWNTNLQNETERSLFSAIPQLYDTVHLCLI